MRHALLMLFMCILMRPVLSGELLEYHVNKVDDYFVLHLDMRVKANYRQVNSVLMDFAKMPEVNDTVVESRLLERIGDRHKIFFASEACIWVFCERIEQVAMVTELGQGYIMSNILVEESDLRHGRSLWHLIDEGSTTRVIYDAEYIPDFWVPPLIGSALAREKMLSEGLKTINGMERVIADQRTGQ
ncbi:MAG: hypothetical protein RI563_00910 [Thiohalophilus sp.]|uniref:hypothetical protein n=1 Tax=Thiohalophilus sp. TaxID=3028392 RepID=UPI00287063B9|nr:hypothetical protein [Thiohalophilus sp.]MDR9435406.1 hypothetical protein [Thiohalophilus sp.]